jgi:hypothetical protein
MLLEHVAPSALRDSIVLIPTQLYAVTVLPESSPQVPLQLRARLVLLGKRTLLVLHVRIAMLDIIVRQEGPAVVVQLESILTMAGLLLV